MWRLGDAELLHAGSEYLAVEWLHEAKCTDGLPVVVPTSDRVEDMLLGIGGLAFDTSLGTLGPGYGDATIGKVAINSVMAGCLPEHFSVVVAAIRALCEPMLDIAEVEGTTHNAAPLIIVNGPIREQVGVASGYGALGPGHRANATIGRAVRLCLINIGGSRPGESDMAQLGQPAKFAFCVGEAEEESPFVPLHVSRGFEAGSSAVTVLCCEGPHSVNAVNVVGMAGSDDSAMRVLELLAAALSNPASNNAQNGRGTMAVALNPQHAMMFADAGYDRAAVQEALSAMAQVRREVMLGEPDAGGASVVYEPESILLFVAGGPGTYSVVMPSWGGGRHGNQAVSVLVDSPAACDVPWSNKAADDASLGRPQLTNDPQREMIV